MSKSKTPSDRFGNIIAVLIALVTVIGAVTSWRIATTLDEAGGADSAGIRAATNKEDVTTRARIILIEHLDAYAAYVKNKTLADKYTAFANSNAGRTDLSDYALAFQYAANQARDVIPESYIDRDGQLDKKRDEGEHIAQDSHDKDVEPQPHFDRADSDRRRATWLFATLVLYGVVLILLTAADAIHNWLGYLLLIGGLVLFTIAALIGVFVELLTAFVFR